MYLIIISDTTCSEILNLKARSRSNRPSLKRVKNSQSSSIGYNFLRHPTLLPGNSCWSLFWWVLASALADSDAASHLVCNLFALLRDSSVAKVLGTAKLIPTVTKEASPRFIRNSHVFLLCLFEGNSWNDIKIWSVVASIIAVCSCTAVVSNFFFLFFNICSGLVTLNSHTFQFFPKFLRYFVRHIGSGRAIKPRFHAASGFFLESVYLPPPATRDPRPETPARRDTRHARIRFSRHEGKCD